MSITFADLGNGIRNDALALLRSRFGDEAAKRAANDVGMAFNSAVRNSQKPEDFLAIASTDIGRASIVNCIAVSALTGLVPGGPNPTCWLIPKGGQLQWWISHRGICTLALRAGYQITPVLVHRDDPVKVRLGVVEDHEPRGYVKGFPDLAGAYLRVCRIADGHVYEPVWIHGAALIKTATNGAPWKGHPAEMLMKAAIKYSAARGFLPIESIDLNAALEAEQEAEAAAETPKATGTARAAAGLPPRAIEDRQGTDAPPDFAAETEALAERVAVPVTGDDDVPF